MYRFVKKLTPQEILESLKPSFISKQELENNERYKKYLHDPERHKITETIVLEKKSNVNNNE
jgi:hypothetical protein